MSTTVTLNGVSYSVPATGESRTWGPSASAYLIAISTTVLQKSGGAFALTADANFGANFGLVSAFFKSYAANFAGTIATTGIVRLGNAESIGWRNAANNANKSLAVDASDKLAFDGATGVTGTELGLLSGTTTPTGTGALVRATSPTLVTPVLGVGTATSINQMTIPSVVDTVVGKATTDTLTNKTLTSPNINTQATIKAGGELRLNNAGDTFYAGFKAQSALAANKIWSLPLADGTVNQVLQTDGSFVLSWAAALTSSLLDGKIFVGNGSNIATAVTPSGDVTMTNAGVMAIGSGVIVNADVSGSAAIAGSKIAAISAKSYVHWKGNSGYGSTNNKIRRFTTQTTPVGSNITAADSATLGCTFTINETGMYAISYSDAGSGGMNLGISVNSNQLTTNIASITDTHRMAIASTQANDDFSCVSGTYYLTSGDVVRAHCDGTTAPTSVARTTFYIAQIL